MFRKTYMITYEGQGYFDFDQVFNIIQSYEIWGRIMDNTWIVKTTQTTEQVRDSIQNSLPPNFRVFVGKTSAPASWYNTICSGDWLKNNL
jgi:hypothetical protein